MGAVEVHVSEDASAAAWIGPKLGGGFGAVTRTVPAGYPAYARICHPAEDHADGWVTWRRVAQVTGRQAHPLMQWHALVGSPDPDNFHGSLWRGGSPRRGHLVPEVLGPLCDLLAGHTATAQDCWFCLWEGWGWITGSPAIGFLGSDEQVSPAFSPEELSRPRVHLPFRNYLLLTGPLHAALQIGEWPRSDWFVPQSPNLFWPADRAWCVATEIDFDSTLLGGTRELVEAVLQAPALDSWAVQHDDSLAADADQLNPVPATRPLTTRRWSRRPNRVG